MRDAAEFPFDASKYAFRTNFDGLTASDENMQTHVTKAAQNYKEALKKFESDHKEAREQYSKDKEEGMTEDEFKDWVGQNVSFVWKLDQEELNQP